MNNHGLAAYAETLLSSKANTWYMYGNNGQKITEKLIQEKKIQYPDNYSDSHIAELRKHIGAIGYDCSSIMDLYTGQDKSANGWLAAATEKGPISTMPEIPGLSVHFNGHVGVYIGDGKVVEARGTWYGIVKTRLKDRPWKNWAKVPGISYEEDDMIYCKRGQGSIANPDKDVTELQNAFIRLGVEMKSPSTGKIYTTADGSYGPATSIGVQNFEKKYGMAVTDGDTFTDLHIRVMLGAMAKLPTGTGITQSQLDAANAKVKAAENARLVVESKLSQVRQARSTLLNF